MVPEKCHSGISEQLTGHIANAHDLRCTVTEAGIKLMAYFKVVFLQSLNEMEEINENPLSGQPTLRFASNPDLYNTKQGWKQLNHNIQQGLHIRIQWIKPYLSNVNVHLTV